jgi:hypothetical protein
MPTIKLIMVNRTQFVLVFSYRKEKFEIAPQTSQVKEVEAGDHLYVRTKQLEYLTKDRRQVEADMTTWTLDHDWTINCTVEGGWELSLHA